MVNNLPKELSLTLLVVRIVSFGFAPDRLRSLCWVSTLTVWLTPDCKDNIVRTMNAGKTAWRAKGEMRSMGSAPFRLVWSLLSADSVGKQNCNCLCGVQLVGLA